MPRHLRFVEVAAGSALHAALVQHGGARRDSGPLHSHDFWEAMYVLEGSGEHQVGNERLPLRAGQLVLIRPADCHTIRGGPGRRLLFINVAFPATAWSSFCAVAGRAEEHQSWSVAALPPELSVPEADRERCAAAFRGALDAFAIGPTKLDLCRFWSAVVPHLVNDQRTSWPVPDDLPKWLRSALGAMELPENMRAGVPHLRGICGVSPAYLARTVRKHLGQSPTEYVNDLRLRRASLLLRTTTKEIIEVAGDCGFENLSYFYRLFRARFGCPPNVFRMQVGEQIAPGVSVGGE